ncbi:MAG: isoleucine--tRNA ligase, partial [Cyclobacteriaceae bacterium]|nr:isoleucine--tRNA ligase [Cyclobacteriaceae bacterium HetDA_MAG_MS6]
SQEEKQRLKLVQELIITETNVKSIEYLDDASGVLVKKIKPNFRKLGAQFGPKMKSIASEINSFGQDEIAALEKEGSLAIEIGRESIKLSLEDVEISSEDIPGWLVASEDGLTVALDITITDELRKEGIARDVVNRIQNLRKEKGLEVQDKINLAYHSADGAVRNSIEENKNYIQRETQALALEYLDNVNGGEQLDIDGKTLVINLEVAK